MARSVSFPSIDYPSADGLPMAESDFQRHPLIYAVDVLGIYFEERTDVYVSGNLFIYYEEGNPEAVVAPDVFVVLGAPKRDRSSYKLWQEPKAPDFVLEITSRRTRSVDQGSKRGIYAFLRVQEYWQYDPTGDYLEPALQGFRLIDQNYHPLSPTYLPQETFSLHSDVLGLDLRLEHGRLSFYDPAAGRKLLSHQETEQARREAEQARREAEQARQAAEERMRQEVAARQAAEARIAELEARLRTLQKEPSSLPPDDTQR
jgi:Uma2 family endonuclease